MKPPHKGCLQHSSERGDPWVAPQIFDVLDGSAVEQCLEIWFIRDSAVDPETTRVGHLLNRHQFQPKKVCMTRMDFPRGIGVRELATCTVLFAAPRLQKGLTTEESRPME